MSLTSQLDDRNSPVSRWVAAHVDQAVVRALVREVNGDLARAIPLVADRTDPQLVGRAFDFAFRWQFGPLAGTVARLGAMFATGEDWADAPAIVHALITAGNVAPTDLRWRACVVLSWFEMFARGYPVPPALAECWGRTATADVVENLLALAPAGPVDDVAALMAAIRDDWDLTTEGPFRLNPTFWVVVMSAVRTPTGSSGRRCGNAR